MTLLRDECEYTLYLYADNSTLFWEIWSGYYSRCVIERGPGESKEFGRQMEGNLWAMQMQSPGC